MEEERVIEQLMQEEKYRLQQRYLDRKYEILLQGSDRGSSVNTRNRIATEKWVTRTSEFNAENEVDRKSMDDFEEDLISRLHDLRTSTAERPQRSGPIANSLGRDERIHKTNVQANVDNRSILSLNPMATSWEVQNQQNPDVMIKPSATFNISQGSSNLNAFHTNVQPSNFLASNVSQPVGVQRPLSMSTVHVLTKAQIASRHVVTKDLPFFYGSPEDWLIFHKRYVNTTELCGYSNAENLDRLQKCLKGDAHDAVVRDLLLDVESVPDIISILETLFGRPELIVKSLLKKLRLLPNPKADHLNTLVKFALDVQNFAKTVQRKALDQFLSNPLLLEELVDKLPPSFKVDWAKYIVSIPNNRVTLMTLSDFMDQLLQVLVKITEYVPKDSTKNDKKQNKWNSERVNSHQDDKSGHKFKKFEEKKDFEKKCKICDKNCIGVENCTIFTSYEPAQRWKAIYDNKLCRKCLRKHGGLCRVNKECGVNNCVFKHHSLLHDDQKHKPIQNVKSAHKDVNDITELSNSHLYINPKVILRFIPIKAYGNGISIDTFAFLEEGSTATLIDQSLADSLKLVGVPKNLCLIWSAKIHRKEKNSQQFNLTISSIDNQTIRFKLREVKSVECLGIPPQRLNKEELCTKFAYLRDVPFANYENTVPGILIGCNNARIGVPRKVIDGDDYGPIAAKTLIGWTVHGPICELRSCEVNQINHYRVEECKCQHEHDESLHQSMKNYFSIDNFGIQVPEKLCTVSKDDEKTLQLMQNITKRIAGRFESGLLWRYENCILPESYGMARRRLECLEKKRPETIKIINDTIAEYLRMNYARKLTKEEASDHTQRHWYLPIFTVTHPKKPEKHRMVFDAAAKVKGVSLNTMLLKGPDQLVSLVEILRRFREKLYALGGDIREMFPQIQINKQDQQCQRFLWRNGDQRREPDVYVMQVMTFGAACSPAVAHFVKNSNANEFSNNFPRAVEAIVRNHYMDDIMDGENSETELIQLAQDVRRVHSHAGFEIRNFLSNSKNVLEALGSSTKTKSKVINPDKDFDIERVLGMWWNLDKDTFTFSLKYLSVTKDILTGVKLPTKRELLKLLMSMFDPLGLISHYLVQLKMIIQDVWRTDSEWDKLISLPETIKAWSNWLDLLPAIESIKIPRLLTPKLAKSGITIELHTFVDASENAFGAVTYLRVEDDTGVDCALIGSKSRVAPLKYLSIPRKELQGGLLGSRLAKNIGESQTFKVFRRVFWTDSSTLLSWLGSDQRKYHQFVAHRVGEILENTNLHEWRWIPSRLNVADDLTKLPKYSIADMSSRWFTAPSFLYDSESHWPVPNERIEETEEEMKVTFAHNELIISPFFDSTRFSDWTRMVRIVAYAIRFTKILKAKIQGESISKSHLTKDELVLAQNVIFRQAQFEGFPDEMVTLELNKILKENKREISKSSSLVSCSPYLDSDGVLRCRGRIDFAKNISTAMKRPVIMPRKNWITKLLIGFYHRIYHHRNHETVINEVRQRYYVPKLRVALKSIATNDCQKCKNRRAKPQPPEEGNLPAGRLAIGFRPFTHTGIDYFGPYYITQGRSTVKRWGVIFTCLTTRAVHIEVAYSMTTQSTIKCIRNFIAIRGQPSDFYSDCGTNLVGTKNEIQKALKDDLEKIDKNQLVATFTSPNCTWHLNPPESKHMGGVWERLVRSIKTSLYEIMPNRQPNDEMFRSLLMEVMNVVNSRPLTFVPLDSANDEAITPNHFLLGSSSGLNPSGNFESNGPILYSTWKEIQRLTDCFWKRFVKEYAPTLIRKTKWFQPVRPIEIDDIVLVIDSKNDRNVYPKVRVIDRIMGSNNQVRRIRVQFANGSIKWRSAAGVARLDISPGLSLNNSPEIQTGGTVAKAQ